MRRVIVTEKFEPVLRKGHLPLNLFRFYYKRLRTEMENKATSFCV